MRVTIEVTLDIQLAPLQIEELEALYTPRPEAPTPGPEWAYEERALDLITSLPAVEYAVVIDVS